MVTRDQTLPSLMLVPEIMPTREVRGPSLAVETNQQVGIDELGSVGSDSHSIGRHQSDSSPAAVADDGEYEVEAAGGMLPTRNAKQKWKKKKNLSIEAAAAGLAQRHGTALGSNSSTPASSPPAGSSLGQRRLSSLDAYQRPILASLLPLYPHEGRPTMPFSSSSSRTTTPSAATWVTKSRRYMLPSNRGSLAGFAAGRLRRFSNQPRLLSRPAAIPSEPSQSAVAGGRGQLVVNKTGRSGHDSRGDGGAERLSVGKRHVADALPRQHAALPRQHDAIPRQQYLVKLCRALMLCGAPTHRLEEHMVISARALEIDAQFLYMPGCMVMSFDDDDDGPAHAAAAAAHVKLVRVTHGLDLGRMCDVQAIYEAVVHGRAGPAEGLARLDEVASRADRHHPLLRVAMFGVASATVGPFAFEGRLVDMPVAFALGCVVGFLQIYVVPWSESFSHVFEVCSAIATTLLARAAGSISASGGGGGRVFCFGALAQSSIALILPGYTVLLASLELQSRSLVAGGVRMVYALVYTLSLGCGMTIGASLYGLADRTASSAIHCEAPVPAGWWHVALVAPFCVALCVIYQARWRQMPMMLATALIGHAVSSSSATRMAAGGGSNVEMAATALGALAVGLVANASSRLGPVFRGRIRPWWDRHVRCRFVWRRRRQQPQQHSNGGSSKHGIDDLADLEAALPAPSSPRPPAPSPTASSASSVLGSDECGGDGDSHSAANTTTSSSSSFPSAAAAAAMLPAIFVLVPSGLAANGSLLAGITSADRLTGGLAAAAGTAAAGAARPGPGAGGPTLSMLFSVVQVAIGISVGLFLSVLIWYPRGKKRTGVFSF